MPLRSVQPEQILSNLHEGISVITPDGRVSFANDAAARFFGYERGDQLVASTRDELTARFDVFDEAGNRLSLDGMPSGRALRGENPPEQLLRLRVTATGEERWAVVKSTPVHDAAGKLMVVLITWRDVTDRHRRALKERYLAAASALLSESLELERTLEAVARLAVPQVADWAAVYLLEGEGRIRLATVAHVDPAKVQVARDYSERHPPDLSRPYGLGHVVRTGSPDLVPVITPEMLERSAPTPEHLEIIRSLGLTSSMLVPMVHRGRILGVLAFFSATPTRHFGQDDLGFAIELARRIATALENARLYSEAVRAVSLRDDFLSVASHELRTPLQTLKLTLQFMERLGEAGRPGDALTKLPTVDRQVRRLNALVDQMLDISRLATGKVELERNRLDAGEFVQNVVRRYEQAGAAVTIEGTLPSVSVSWDALRAEQVLSNLLDNAVKYGGGKPVHVTATQAGDQVRISIRDEGIGIADADLQRIFDKFERAVPSQNYGGLGLGLHIARELVRAHGGTLFAESIHGQGSTFTVLLPIEPEKARTSQHPAG